MNDHRHGVRLPWPGAVIGGIGLVAAGAIGAAMLGRNAPTAQDGPHLAAPRATDGVVRPEPQASPSVTLSPELVRRAGVEVAIVTTVSMDARLNLPGQVQPNAYRSVTVTPLVAGRITSVRSALGEVVSPGQVMAQVYSPDFARAQTAFLAGRAELAAHEQRLARTERLVKIGASSQQELEQVHAEHTAKTAEVETARSTLELLGLSAERIAELAATSAVEAVADVRAPIAGVTTERQATVGLNVDPSMPLFTVVDLSTVWVVADLYERDSAAAPIGSRVTVTTSAYPGFTFDGRVSYIDPQVAAETRTAKLRVEVPNRDGQLRLGMYVQVSLRTPADAPSVVVPVEAVQSIGNRAVVYVPGRAEGTFVEREVRVGRRAGDVVPVESGLTAGETVVVRGAFFLRAEHARASAGSSAPTGSPERGR